MTDYYTPMLLSDCLTDEELADAATEQKEVRDGSSGNETPVPAPAD